MDKLGKRLDEDPTTQCGSRCRAPAVHAYRAFSSFLLGHLLLEVAALGVDTGPTDDPEPATAAVPPEQLLAPYPVLTRLADRLAAFRFDEEFDESLHNLLERIGPGAGRNE